MNFRLLVVILAFAAGAAHGAEVLNAEVARAGERYEVHFDVILLGDADQAWDIITDYPGLVSISDTVKSSRLIRGRNGGDARIEVVLRPCVLMIFCKTMTKTSDVRAEPRSRRLRFTAVAGAGDFNEARETIELRDASRDGRERVRFSYDAVLEPAFFVPPFLGPWLIKRAIIEDLESSSRRVEQQLAGRGGDG